jgi:RHS repeat-associated protein
MNGDAAHAISYRYNLLGKVDSIQDPHLGKITYLYSPFGDIIRHTNARNQVTSFNYDILGRPTVSSSPEGVTRWYYDSQPYGIGQLDYSQFVFDNAQYYRLTKSCKYDKMGRLIRSTQDIDGDTTSYAFKYNIYGYQKKIVYPSGFVVQTEYDKRGFTSKISNPVYGTLWKLVSQNPFGNVTSSELGKVYSSNKYYNSQTDRLVKIRLMSKSPYKVLYEGKYNWNILGSNFNSRSDIGIFTYGENNAGPQAVTSIQTQNGVFPSTTQSVLQYTSFEKIKEMNENPWALKVLYDEAGQKLIQSITNTQSQETATTLYQGFSEKVTNNGMVKTTDYIASPEGVIAIFTRNNNSDSTLHYILKDYAGSMIGILNPNGTYAQEMNYDPWGRRRDPATWQAFNNTPPPALYSRGYTMHEHLAHYGLIDMKGRVYDPLVGRFLSPDPFIQAPEFSLSFNRYSYCLNNPLLYTDPTGFFAEGPDIGTSGFYNNLSIDDDLGNVNSSIETGCNTHRQTDWVKDKPGQEAYFDKNVTSKDDPDLKGRIYVGKTFRELRENNFLYYGDEKGDLYQDPRPIFSFKKDTREAQVQREFDDIPLNPAVGMGERIVGIANAYVGSTDYNLLSKKSDFLPGNPKCNKFVYDVLLQAGASPGLPNQSGRWGIPGPKPPIAIQWANANYNIPGWVIVSSPMPGDVASFNGHVGIVFRYGLTISATLRDGVVRNDWGFRTGQTPVFRRFVGYSPFY